jgi:hypothetical protein
MKRMITAIATVGVPAVLIAATPAFADLHGKG